MVILDMSGTVLVGIPGDTLVKVDLSRVDLKGANLKDTGIRAKTGQAL